MTARRRLWPFLLLAAMLAAAASACSSVRYYSQAVRGGLGVVLRAESIDHILARSETPDELARQLGLVQDLRRFAADTLGLRVGKNYRTYLDLERDVAVWNVVAAPELSVEPRTWCFPVAGCVSYRGYFRRAGAERFAARLERQGDDVAISGATAYSTLGWLRDPVLNTFLDRSDAQLAGLLFHELAHATLYAKGDTPFNESFATVIEEAGVRQWLEAANRREEWSAYARHSAAERSVLSRLVALRASLEELYRSAATAEDKREEKTKIVARFQTDFAQAIAEQPDLAPWHGWAERSINNADLAAVGVYWQWVAPLGARLAARGWQAFLGEMNELAELSHQQRQTRLESLP